MKNGAKPVTFGQGVIGDGRVESATGVVVGGAAVEMNWCLASTIWQTRSALQLEKIEGRKGYEIRAGSCFGDVLVQHEEP